MAKKDTRGFAFWLGIVLILAYWLLLRPPGWGRLGYNEDLGSIELSRQLIADGIQQYGRPTFTTQRMMAPTGITAAYYSWSLERDWIGAYFWLWDRDFPWLWFYFGVSLLFTFIGVGKILRWMGLSKSASSYVSLAVTLFHIPRHFKIYYHYEYLPQHWVYLSVFLDAWIWQRFVREKKFSWVLELWRGVCFFGTFGLTGYFWGPMVLEYFLVRAGIVVGLFLRRRKGVQTVIEWKRHRAVLPAALILLLFSIDLRWFVPLVSEVNKLGPVWQPISWFASFSMVFRPLWLEELFNGLGWFIPGLGQWLTGFFASAQLIPVEWPETVVTVGWFYWIPAILGVTLLARSKNRTHIFVVAPLAVLMTIMIFYVRTGWLPGYQTFIRKLVPFMAYVRVASRMGIFFPIILTAITVLCWPELKAWYESAIKTRGKWHKTYRLAFGIFALSSVGELIKLSTPIISMPPMNEGLKTLLAQVHDLPGTTVLDLPFCVAGGNAYCTEEQCPQYPNSTAPATLTGWHDKSVYGVYQARLVPAQCEIYNKPPYTSWFKAWAQDRCFTETEWKDFCAYVSDHKELSAILIYPDIWKAVGRPECLAQFEKVLGRPLSQADFSIGIKRGGEPTGLSRVWRYTPRCMGVY